MLCAASSVAVRRVSSQAIRSASPRILIARAVTSPRLPIGVATTNRTPEALFFAVCVSLVHQPLALAREKTQRTIRQCDNRCPVKPERDRGQRERAHQAVIPCLSFDRGFIAVRHIEKHGLDRLQIVVERDYRIEYSDDRQ